MAEQKNATEKHVDQIIDASFDAANTVVFLVGPPAAGKSSIAESLVKKGYTRLNKDEIRGELYGDQGIYGDQDEINKIFHERLDAAQARGEQILLDNTNCHRGAREKLIKRMQDAGCKQVVLLVMMTPLETCLERNRKRSRQVPEDVIKLMHKQMTGSHSVRQSEGRVIELRPGKDKDHFEV